MWLTDLFQYGFVDAARRVVAVDGGWPVVVLIGYRIELRSAVNRQIRPFGEVLPDRPIDILETAAMPWAVRVSEVPTDSRVSPQLHIPGQLIALVVRQRLAHRFCNAAQLGRKAFQGRCGRGVRQFGRHHQARSALHQHAHSRPFARSFDEVAFPLPGKSPVVGLRWPHMDAKHFRQLYPAVFSPGPRHALALGSAQAGNLVIAQFPLRHVIDTVVNGLVREGAMRGFRPHALECARDLRRRPLLRQKVVHQAKEHGAHRQLGATTGFEALAVSPQTNSASIVGKLRCRHKSRTVLTSGKALEFTCDGRSRAIQGEFNVPRRAFLICHHHHRGSLSWGEFFVMDSHSSTSLDGGCTLLLIPPFESRRIIDV